MDVHFNAYKARYAIMDQHIRRLEKAQYVNSLNIFINLDDLIHSMHRPLVEKEFELCGIKAPSQFTSNVINLIGHYKQWVAKKKIPCNVYVIYTSAKSFKNRVYIQNYRKYFNQIMDVLESRFLLINSAVGKALPIAKNICEYVSDVHMIDSGYMEPSIIPWFLKESGIATGEWSMVISRDLYDLQYSYRDKWILVSPKGDNTWFITRANMWTYLGAHEKVDDVSYNQSLFHHDIYPLALAVAGNKYRSIPRLRRIGWKTIFKYLDEITRTDTVSPAIIGNRLLELLTNRGVKEADIQNNFAVCTVEGQVGNMNDIDKVFITDQIKYVTDHEALSTLDELYFREFPLNLPFLTASWKPSGPFSH